MLQPKKTKFRKAQKGRMKGLSQIGIVAYLVKTVQELEARIKELEG